MIIPTSLNRFNKHSYNLIKINDLSALFPTLFEYYARNDRIYCGVVPAAGGACVCRGSQSFTIKDFSFLTWTVPGDAPFFFHTYLHSV